MSQGNKGFKNNGNTCYLNAVLQCLSHIDILSNNDFKQNILKYKKNNTHLLDEWLNIQDYGWIDSENVVLGRINCLPTDTVKILQQINLLSLDNTKQKIHTLTNSKRGLIKYKLPVENIEDTTQTIQYIRDNVRKYNGYTVIENSGTFDKNKLNIWGDLPDSFSLMKKLKSEFDPVNILNSGRFIGGI